MKISLLGTSCLIGLMAFVPAAYGQAASTAPAKSAQAADEPVGLQEIIVTAQRRSENLQRAAVAVTAVSGNQLVSSGVNDPTALTSIVPALNVANVGGPYVLYYLRGVGNFNVNPLSDSAIAVNIDGVFIARPNATSGLYYDVDRIEVLKGPQGTLYGRNATGGAVNIITRQPKLNDTSGEVSASYGNYDAVQVNGAANVPLGEKAAIRVAAQHIKHDGYLSDGTNDQNDLSGRLQLLWQPQANLTFKVGGDYFEMRGRGSGATVLTDANGDRKIGLFDPRSDAAFTSTYFFPSGTTYNVLPKDIYQRNKFWGAYASAELKMDFATLSTIAGYRAASLDFRSAAPSFLLQQREKDKEFTLETRLASNGSGPIDWLIGGYFFSENIDVPQVSFNQNGLSASEQFYDAHTSSVAAFGRLTGHVSDTFRLTAGGRFTNERKRFDGDFYSGTLLCGGTVLAPPGTPVANCFGAPVLPNTATPLAKIFAPDGSVIPFQLNGFGSAIPGGPATTPSFLAASLLSKSAKRSFNKFTWRAGFEWDVLDHSLLYGSYETGFKSGGFFFTVDDPVYQPETIQSWTLGMKNRFFDNRLQLNIEAFWWKYKDQQVSSVSRDSAGNVVLATRNVGRSTNKGIEVEAQALVTSNTRISATVQYLDAKYDSFKFLTPNNSPQVPGLETLFPPLANCPATLANPTTLYLQDCSGRTPPNAPKWIMQFGVQQTVPIGDWRVVLDAGTRYQSDTWTALEYLPQQLQKAYWQSDASVTITAPNDRYYVTAYVHNIEDNDVISASLPNPFAGATLVVGNVRPPRTYGLRVGAKF